ncbi:hypoxic response protein 1 [Saccharopolyspora subtropica]|uniref:Hypoxic response protein 1 n=1 Tax=Saccharopolyspora thermophila TaxID=89367 RepID=A0A917JUU1_9PSEU|nr:CBS domain-containing protein [Saccharopolyspora subtropica]GGI86062.1 hypoxic response protein 1 [Saccharopolyspora subtropica]
MTKAREIMHAGAQCIGEDESLYKAAQMMRDLNVGSLPICGRDDRLHGIITDRDIVIKCCAEGRNPAEVKAGELAQGKPHWVDAESDIDQVLTIMEQHQIRRVPVISEHRLVGMISEADVARNLTDDQIAHFVESIYAAR